MNYSEAKDTFKKELQEFANSLKSIISQKDEWTIKGFIDVFRNVYTISSDTKIISKVLELHLFPYFLQFAEKHGYTIELANHQNYYPDLTFISKKNPKLMFALDLKTTYRNENNPAECNGFTLGSHGEYFKHRDSTKNIQHPYAEYKGHFCLGIIYSRREIDKYEEAKRYDVSDVASIPSVICNFLFFVEEKWKIASDKCGSGNTANIGSVKIINDLVNGNGVFAKAGESLFDEYWMNYGEMQIKDEKGSCKKLSSFEELLTFKNLPKELNNKRKR